MSTRSWRFPRMLLNEWLSTTLWSWVGSVVFVLAIVVAVSYVRDIDVSGWQPLADATRWYVAVVAGYIFYRSLPLYVAHGHTRRDFAIEAVILLAILTFVVAVLVTLGFLIEAGVYDVANWQRGQLENHLFSTYDEYALIFAEYWLTSVVWAVSGALIGAAWYRAEALGAFSIIPALALVSVIDFATGGSMGGPFGILERLSSSDVTSVGVASVATILCAVVGGAIIWVLVRDVSIRNRYPV